MKSFGIVHSVAEYCVAHELRFQSHTTERRCIRFSCAKSIQIGHLPGSRQFTTPSTRTCRKLDRIKIRAIFSEGVNIFAFFFLFFCGNRWFDVVRLIANRMHSRQTTAWMFNFNHQRVYKSRTENSAYIMLDLDHGMCVELNWISTESTHSVNWAVSELCWI